MCSTSLFCQSLLTEYQGGTIEKGGIIHQSAESAGKRTLPRRNWCLALDLIGREGGASFS